MTLDEAINHLNETLEDDSRVWSCEECKQEHVQLREWLIELKSIKETHRRTERIDAMATPWEYHAESR